MQCILSGILFLEQHLKTIQLTPEVYRPECCPSCGKGGIWCHGNYSRKPDRFSSGAESLNPIPILRFRCSNCGKTCSVLPECLPPRFWYLWCIQQRVLIELLMGKSLREVNQTHRPSRSTCRRWWLRLKDRFLIQRDALCAQISSLREHVTFDAFWKSCFSQLTLSAAMLICNQSGVIIS